MALVGVKLETLVFEPDTQTTRPPLLHHNCFAWKIAFNTVLQSLQIYNPQQRFQQEMFFIELLA